MFMKIVIEISEAQVAAAKSILEIDEEWPTYGSSENERYARVSAKVERLNNESN